jgi:Pyridoxamine 5'-phosphate oxidase
MTASLPPEIQAVFASFVTTEYTTVDAKGQPITWPVTPYYARGGDSIDVTTGIGYPKKAYDARANHHVAVLFSEPKGSGIDDAPMVLVQGCAKVDDADLDANADRYAREAPVKLPGASLPPRAVRRMFGWYFQRLYVYVRPERVFVWRGGDPTAAPELFGDHMEEVRSGHSEEPEEGHADPGGGALVWDERLDELGATYDTAVLSLVAPDGFPFSIRVPVRVDRGAKRIHVDADIPAAPLEPGPACVTAHDHDPDFKWQRNFQVRGDLRRDDAGAWFLEPHKLVGGFELPPSSALQRTRDMIGWTRKYRRIAKRELAKRT